MEMGVCLGGIHKPRGHLRERGYSTLLLKPYIIKVSMKGESGQKCTKFCRRGLYTAPNNVSKWGTLLLQNFVRKLIKLFFIK